MPNKSKPKTLAERLDWMAKNLPGFADELSVVDAIERVAAGKRVSILKRSGKNLADTESAKRARK